MTNKITFYGFFVLIAVIIGILVFQGQSDGDKKYIDTLHEQIDALNENISRLEEENSQIAVDLSLKADSLVLERSISADAINKRRSAIKYYEKRIRDRDNLAVNDLDSLFADRFSSRAPEVDGDRGN